MDTNKFTQKALSAINNAQMIALEKKNQELKPEHLALSLIQDKEGLVNFLTKLIEKGEYPNNLYK